MSKISIKELKKLIENQEWSINYHKEKLDYAQYHLDMYARELKEQTKNIR
jgi:hypothetical protein